VIDDFLMKITGRVKLLANMMRLLNKKVNVLILGERGIGKTFCLSFVYECYVNAKRDSGRFIYLKAHGGKRDLEQILYPVCEKYKDIQDGESYSTLVKGNQQSVERRILTAIKNSPGHYYIFIEEQKKIPEGFRIFLKELLATGNVTVIAETNSMNDARTRSFYQGFEKVRVEPLDEVKTGRLFDYFVDKLDVSVKEEDYSIIKSKLSSEVAGNPGRLYELLARGTKEKQLRREEIENYPTSFRKEFSIGWSLTLMVVFGMAYRYFLRGSSSISDATMGGVIFAFSLLSYRLISRVK